MNMDTIWDETYKATCVNLDGHAEVRITTAIHSSASVISEMQIDIITTNSRSIACACLNAYQLERLAGELLAAAQRRRELDTMLACHLAATQLPEAT